MTDTTPLQLDTCGLMCPEPIMLLHARVRQMASGEEIQIIATDPATLRDVPKFCQFLGHALVSQHEAEGKYFYRVRKK